MIRLLPSVPESIHDFRTNPWPCQKTLVTPRKNMRSFLSTLLTVFPIEQGTASTDQVVFEPDNLMDLLKGHEVIIENRWSFCIEASKAEGVSALLGTMLNDWIDFVFVPSPAAFAIYADHDEYLTIYTPTTQQLNHLIDRLELEGFSFIGDYMRPSEGAIWR
jgi:hypothetical protein